ncbi:phage tail tube protein [Janthinobacterium fluminis]|uniref:Phage tail tube protein n=1 Tax=Janthinobacterium fluminis TaxID=2987524 RepID=A0ABT5JUU5_9BURK|nr:phage tail tube protein [Janthinobacterium fluminis]MDC8756261.1 phage tail tube protein [Janthinobacterium fluminis]
MAQVPTGTMFFIASAYGPPKVVTGVSNAIEAVVSSPAHGFSAGDIVEHTSGWGRINRRVFRVKAPAADTYVLEGMDTTSIIFYPAGNGAGSVRKIATFTQITTVMNPASTGGEPKTVNFKFMESDAEYSINDGFAASGYTANLDADSIGSPGYAACKALTEVQTDTCLKMVSRSGALILQPCTVALNEAVKFQDGQINQVSVAFNGNNRLTRYAA